jgi:prepilin-type N-terminal cleavage/methylation domain-containing protein
MADGWSRTPAWPEAKSSLGSRKISGRVFQQNRVRGFTLVEIMIVVAIIGLLSVLAVPAFIKARKQSQGRRILNDVRQMDAAIDQWALETVKKDGDTVVTTEASLYMKSPWRNNDSTGNPFVLGPVGPTQVVISVATKTALNGAGVDWGGY